MANNETFYLSSDIYDIARLMEDIKQRNLNDLDSITLSMSIFGYMSEAFSAILQSATVMASEYSNEAIPVKAKFEKNIITHALTLGVEKINAQPAEMQVMLQFPEDALLANMINDKFTFDREFPIKIGDFEFHTDYDFIIQRVKLVDGSYVYTAMYDLSVNNPISSIVNPYLPPTAMVNLDNVAWIGVNCTIHQVEYKEVYKKIISSNPLENKIFNFTFDSQLADFNLEVEENGEIHYLTPVYDGLLNDVNGEYCNYSYLDINNIRIKFVEDSYYPRLNADVTVNIYTTQGSGGNFEYVDQPIIALESERFNYDRLYMRLQPITNSENGIDRKTIKELKQIIPKEALARKSITSETDLNNFFNSINTDEVKLLFFRKIDNVLEKLWYSYILMRYDNIVIPTNTIPVNLIRSNFDGITNDNYVFYTGNMIYYTGFSNGTVENNPDEEDIDSLEETGFVYFNPFTCVINKTPSYVSYYLTVIHTNKFLTFEYVNRLSQLQFIANTIGWKREFFTDRDLYKLDIQLSQNISQDLGVSIKDENNETIDVNMKVALVLYNDEGAIVRYKFANFVSEDDGFVYNFQVTLHTDNTMDDMSTRIKIDDCIDAGYDTVAYGYFGFATKAMIYVYVKNQVDSNAGRADADKVIPGMDGFDLCNIYGIQNGIDFLYSYSHIMSSSIKISKQSDTSLLYTINKMPVIRYKYVNNEERLTKFIEQLEIRRNYIEECLINLENPFGIDLMFFNTYGPSKLFSIVDEVSKIDRVNLSLKFRCKLNTISDRYIADDIIQYIKDYIEDINEGIMDLHMSNLVTEITNTYKEQIVFFEFVEINDYGPAYEHIFRVDTDLTGKIPEFLCVNVRDDDSPDIDIEFV